MTKALQPEQRQHTPGPWRREECGSDEFAIRADFDEHNVLRVATVKWCNGQELANADLIAAAPDMLAAAVELDRLMLIIESAVRIADRENHKAVVKALVANLDAIKRAEGR